MQDTTLHLSATLLAADDGNAYFYAALVFIAFVSWVVGRIKEGVARFKAAQQKRAIQLRQRGTPSGSPASPPPVPAMSQRERTQAALRATYRALGLPLPEDEDEAPLSGSVHPDDLLTRDERIAQHRQRQLAAAKPKRSSLAKSAIAVKKPVVPRPRDSYTLKVRGRETRGPGALRKLLRDRATVRQAILLKEILDPPKALRKDSGFGI